MMQLTSTSKHYDFRPFNTNYLTTFPKIMFMNLFVKPALKLAFYKVQKKLVKLFYPCSEISTFPLFHRRAGKNNILERHSL